MSDPGAAPRRAAVLGDPVAHSLSPALHTAAYAALGLAGWHYTAVRIDQEALPGFLAGLDESWVGLSLTMPLKRAVLPLLADVSALATAVGAVNTVLVGPGGRLSGDNTDVHGIVAALEEGGVTRVERAAVLGAGATAASAIAALQQLGCDEPTVYARSPHRAADVQDAAARLDVSPHLLPLAAAGIDLAAAAVDVVISTVPAGALDERAGEIAAAVADGAALPGARRPALLDVVYAGWPTPLARAWEQAGGVAVGGLAMLLHQAAAQVQLMTGRRPPVEAMRSAGLAAAAAAAEPA